MLLRKLFPKTPPKSRKKLLLRLLQKKYYPLVTKLPRKEKLFTKPL